MNTSLPCNTECPIELSTLINCNIQTNKHQLNYAISSRKPSKRLDLLEAIPFTLYNISGSKNCHISYIGPKFLMFDEISKGLMPVPRFESLEFVLHTKNSIDCSKEYFHGLNWTTTHCSIENTFLDIQMIYGQEFNYIYCYENNITIYNRRFVCPGKPFKLSTKSNFSVNDFKYRGIYDMAILFANTFNWSETTNKFLNRIKNNVSLNLDDYYREINKIDIKSEVKEFKNNTQFILLAVMTTLIIISMGLTIYCVFRLRLMRQRNLGLNSFRQEIAYETAREIVRAISDPDNTYIRGPVIQEIE